MKMKPFTDKEFIIELIKLFKNAKRIGSNIDIPEGARCISISDTLANEIAKRLEKIQERGINGSIHN